MKHTIRALSNEQKQYLKYFPNYAYQRSAAYRTKETH